MFKKFKKFIFILLIIIITPQCSMIGVDNLAQDKPTITTPEQRENAWQNNKARLSNLKKDNKWTLIARLGIVSKENSASSQLDWVNNHNKYNISLNNAITFGEVTITNNKANNKVKLTYDGKEYLANNPEELLLKLTGLKLPISELQYWILGLPSPSSNYNNFNLNQYATLETLTQAGFNISYENYSIYNNYILPTKVTLKTPGLRIKIQIEDWKV